MKTNKPRKYSYSEKVFVQPSFSVRNSTFPGRFQHLGCCCHFERIPPPYSTVSRLTDHRSHVYFLVKMGRKGKETTEADRKLIIRLHKQCWSLKKIADAVGRPRSTVQSIIDRVSATKTLKNQPRSGRPKSLSESDKRFVVREIKKNPRSSAPKIASEQTRRGTPVSASTVRKTLREEQYHGRQARKKFWVSKVNRDKRLRFAEEHRNTGSEIFDKTVCTDESKYNVFGSDGSVKVWRQPNAELEPRNLIPTVKHGGGSVMVWGCMSAKGVGNLHFIEGTIVHMMYIDILKKNLRASAEKMGLGADFIFQQNNDPKHTARNTKLWLLYNAPKRLETPPQSPDLNPIEHLWHYLETKIRERHISNKKNLQNALKEEWEKIPPSLCADLVASMPRRIQAVIAAILPSIDVMISLLFDT